MGLPLQGQWVGVTYTAGVLPGVAGADHAAGDAAGGVAAVGAVAPAVGPDLDLDLPQLVGLGAGGGEGAPAGDLDLLAHEGPGVVGLETDGLHPVGRVDLLGQGQDGHVIVLEK